MTDISTAELLELIEQALGRFRTPESSSDGVGATRLPESVDFETAAFWLVQAELLKLPAFGIQMLLRDLERLDGLSVASDVRQITSAPALAVDATALPGHVALAMTARLAAQAVRTQGSAILGIRHVGALGILGCAARSMALDGAIAVISANSSAFVAPKGGHSAAIGTNPLAVAAPRLDAPPFVLDYSTSPMTLAALKQARQVGGALPDTGALDARGQLTDKAAEATAFLPEGRVGSLTGLAVELMTGVGVGGRVPAGHQAPERSALVMAYSPEAMGNTDAAQLCDQLTRDWARAGGHVPGRFDDLPVHRKQLPASLTVSLDALTALRARS